MSDRRKSEIITDILGRIAALEKLLDGTPKQPKRRLNKREVAEREGVGTRTIDRRVVEGSLPPPDIIDGRCYWWEHVLEAHDVARLRKAAPTVTKMRAASRARVAIAREALAAEREAQIKE
jgi:predicted DNA-binding transcriptional regulator AlpA